MALLAIAVGIGLVMAAYRFFSDRPSPAWLPKVHGFAAVSALALLSAGWASTEFSRAASFGLLALLIAAAGGVVLNLGYRGRQKPLPEGLVFAHMSLAFVGTLVVGMVMMSLSST